MIPISDSSMSLYELIMRASAKTKFDIYIWDFNIKKFKRIKISKDINLDYFKNLMVSIYYPFDENYIRVYVIMRSKDAE